MAIHRTLSDRALGISTAQRHSGQLHVEKRVTISRPAEEIYRFWRDFENLPRFMKHLKSVTADHRDCSHWVVRGPAGATVEWDAEVTIDRPGQMICWCSPPNADVGTDGCVRFEPAPGGRGQ